MACPLVFPPPSAYRRENARCSVGPVRVPSAPSPSSPFMGVSHEVTPFPRHWLLVGPFGRQAAAEGGCLSDPWSPTTSNPITSHPPLVSFKQRRRFVAGLDAISRRGFVFGCFLGRLTLRGSSLKREHPGASPSHLPPPSPALLISNHGLCLSPHADITQTSRSTPLSNVFVFRRLQIRCALVNARSR